MGRLEKVVCFLILVCIQEIISRLQYYIRMYVCRLRTWSHIVLDCVGKKCRLSFLYGKVNSNLIFFRCSRQEGMHWESH